MNKMFKNCPYATRQKCDGCRMETRCTLRKLKRKVKRKVKANILNILVIFVLILSAIVLVSAKKNSTESELHRKTAFSKSNELSFVNYSRKEAENAKKRVDLQGSFIIRLYLEEDIELQMLEETSISVEEPRVSAEGPGELYYYNINAEERKALEKVVYAEAGIEPYVGKVAVAAVVLNRYVSGSKEFDTSSVISVIKQKCQFASIEHVTQAELDASSDCAKAVEDALKGWDPTRAYFEKGALFFFDPRYVKGYQKEIREGIDIYMIGDHAFHINFEKIK